MFIPAYAYKDERENHGVLFEQIPRILSTTIINKIEDHNDKNFPKEYDNFIGDRADFPWITFDDDFDPTQVDWSFLKPNSVVILRAPESGSYEEKFKDPSFQDNTQSGLNDAKNEYPEVTKDTRKPSEVITFNNN